MEIKLHEKTHYQDCLEQGLVYQDFVTWVLVKRRGLVLSNFSSRLYQFNVGENFQGFEIKGDFTSSKTGNLLIETEERTSIKNSWVASGIYRRDNTKIYIVGNYSFFYLFDVKVLRREHQDFLATDGDTEIHKEFQSKTGKGFLWKIDDIEKRETYIDKVNCRQYTIPNEPEPETEEETLRCG